MPRKRKSPASPKSITPADIERALIPTNKRQLGEPTREREAKAPLGFERQQLAVGVQDGVISAKVRAPLHHPDLRFEATAKAIASAIESNSPLADPIRLTPVEKQLNQIEHRAAWWHMEWQSNRDTGRMGSVNLNGGGRSSEPGNKLAIHPRAEIERRAFVAVSKSMPEAMLEFMEGFALMHHPEMRPEETAMQMHDLAFQRGFDSQDRRRMTDFATGYLKATADVIEHNREVYRTMCDRKRSAAQREEDKARQKRVLGIA